jgi:hypothetical protein
MVYTHPKTIYSGSCKCNENYLHYFCASVNGIIYNKMCVNMWIWLCKYKSTVIYDYLHGMYTYTHNNGSHHFSVQYTKPFNEEERLKLSKTCGPICFVHSKGLQGFSLCIWKHTNACTAQKMLGSLEGDLLSFACKPSTIQKIILLSLERPAPLDLP